VGSQKEKKMGGGRNSAGYVEGSGGGVGATGVGPNTGRISAGGARGPKKVRKGKRKKFQSKARERRRGGRKGGSMTRGTPAKEKRVGQSKQTRGGGGGGGREV